MTFSGTALFVCYTLCVVLCLCSGNRGTLWHVRKLCAAQQMSDWGLCCTVVANLTFCTYSVMALSTHLLFCLLSCSCRILPSWRAVRNSGPLRWQHGSHAAADAVCKAARPEDHHHCRPHPLQAAPRAAAAAGGSNAAGDTARHLYRILLQVRLPAWWCCMLECC